MALTCRSRGGGEHGHIRKLLFALSRGHDSATSKRQFHNSNDGRSDLCKHVDMATVAPHDKVCTFHLPHLRLLDKAGCDIVEIGGCSLHLTQTNHPRIKDVRVKPSGDSCKAKACGRNRPNSTTEKAPQCSICQQAPNTHRHQANQCRPCPPTMITLGINGHERLLENKGSVAPSRSNEIHSIVVLCTSLVQ